MDRETLGRIVRDAWIAWARENPVRCERCAGRGNVIPSCLYCDDSTYDHECPGAKPCDDCAGTGKLVRPDWIAPWEEMPEVHREADRRIGETVVSAAREACAALCERMAHDLETVPMGPIRDAVARRDLAVSELRRAAGRIRAGGRDG